MNDIYVVHSEARVTCKVVTPPVPYRNGRFLAFFRIDAGAQSARPYGTQMGSKWDMWAYVGKWATCGHTCGLHVGPIYKIIQIFYC